MMRSGPAAVVAAALPLVATVGNSVVGSAEVAAADDGPTGNEQPWAAEQAVGYCGLTRGNTVRWWQTILWADGLLSGTGDQQVDGVFGENTKNATMAWQKQHHLGTSEVDGCAGVTTYRHAQAHLNYAGFTPEANFANSEWKYPGSKRPVRYIWIEALEGTGFDWHWDVEWIPWFRISCHVGQTWC